MNAKVFSVLFVLVYCVHISQQQLNRPANQIHSLTYSESDFNPLPPVARPTTTTTSTTTTETPESTTKKKGGFFSGFTGLFKSKDKESTTTQAPTTSTKKSIQTIPTTVKSIPLSSSTVKSVTLSTSSSTTSTTTPVTITSTSAPSRIQTPVNIPTIPPRPSQPSTTSTASPKKTTKDEFPTLPTVRPQQSSVTGPQSPPVSNAWGKPISFATTTSTMKPQSIQSSTAKPHPDTSKPIGSGLVTDAELLTLSESLFSKDIHNPFKYVTVNYQGRTQSSASTDEASQPMLAIDEKLFSMSTVEKMKLMFNNYEQDTSINEYVTPIERKEENDFIEAVMSSPVMRHAMNFLQQKGVVTLDPQTHRELLKTIWFNLYSRGNGKIGSSGFEHVFLSEVKDATVIGLHNWVYFAEAEKAGDLDYKGWTKKIDLGNKGQIAKVRFTLNGLNKPSNSLFIGTSPELELAIYTVCFELRADQECRLAYGGKTFNIVTHSFRYRGKNLIGSAYPEI